MLHEVVPSARTISVLLNPSGRTGETQPPNELQLAARGLGLQLNVVRASTEPVSMNKSGRTGRRNPSQSP